MFKEDIKKFNHVLIGLIIGLITPVAIMQYLLQKYSNLSLVDLIVNPFFSPLLDNLKICLFINGVLFFLFYWFKKDKSAKGIFIATLIYAGFYIWYMFFS